jgi:primosomal protein N' (replication factor Y) (superfamily II helicase)
VLTDVPPEPALVVATPGAEPVVEGGYAAALLLDAWALLARPGLRAGEEALRRWFAAAALVRPAAQGGRVVVLAGSGLAPVQALVRWDPFGHAERELADRAELGFPPALRVGAVDGPADAVAELLADADLGAATVLGPVPSGPDTAQALVRVPRRDGLALAAALHAAQAARSARKAVPVRVRIDPVDLG